MAKILVTGACGQLGTELTLRLRSVYGNEDVVASDIQDPADEIGQGPFEYLDVLKGEALVEAIERYDIDIVYHLVALLSANAEQNMSLGWNLNMNGLLNVLKLAKSVPLKQVFWPSSIAVFGPDAPRKDTPQNTVLNPQTVYGISKMAGEQWCAYYANNFGVDVRSVRYPGLIGYQSLPGGGTTDYAVEVYQKALRKQSFTCYLEKDSYLPMMYMEDAVDAAIQLMQADSGAIGIRTSYNLSAISFSPEEIVNAIQKFIPDLEVEYVPDYRQQIADSWPDSIDDSPARKQWGWEHQFDLQTMVEEMFQQLTKDRNPRHTVIS